MVVGVIDVVKTKSYHAFESTGGYIRTEQIGTEFSDLFNPIHFSEIEIDGVVYSTVNETVSALNGIVFTVDSSGSGGDETITTLLDNGDKTFTYTSEDSTATTIDFSADLSNYNNFSQTQWSTTLATALSVSTGSNVNLFSLLQDTDKSIGGTTTYDEYSINASDLIVVPYVGKPYEDLRIKHDIRINFNIVTGNTQNYKIELRRFDDSVIGSPIKVTRNADETGVQEVLLTYVSSSTDSFVTGGFYISFTNDSGSSCELTGGLGVLIFNTFQKPVKF